MINKEMVEQIVKEMLPIDGSVDIKIDKFKIGGEEWWGLLFRINPKQEKKSEYEKKQERIASGLKQ